MGKKRKWITKSEITKILKTYSIRPDEFQPIEGLEYSYQSQYVTGYVVTIMAEELNKPDYHETTGRIMVSHTQPNGKITFVDIWERDRNDHLQFKFRNLQNQPSSDIDYIKQLEQENAELIKTGRELKQELKKPKNMSHKDCDTLLKQIESLKQENQKLKENIKNIKKAGRPLSQKRINAIKQMQKLMDQGCGDQEIMKRLDISRATYFRYKKSIINITDTKKYN